MEEVDSPLDVPVSQQTVTLSGIIGVPAHLLAALLKDIHTIELYGFPYVTSRCLLESFLLPTDTGAVRRCTLNFGRYQGCMLREQLAVSKPTSTTRAPLSSDRVSPSAVAESATTEDDGEYTIQLRYLDVTDSEVDRSPFGAEGRAVLLEAVSTYVITPITTSPHQCFFRLTTSLLLRDEASRDESKNAALRATHERVRAFWAAYGEELFTAIQRYVVSKAYTPRELSRVDATQEDAEEAMTSLEQTYLDLVGDARSEVAKRAVLDLLESALVHIRRLLTAYHRARYQALAERAVPADTHVSPGCAASASSPSASDTDAQEMYRRHVGDRIQAESDALRVQTIVEMERQRDLLQTSLAPQHRHTLVDHELPGDGDDAAAAVPLTMIDVRVPSTGFSARFTEVLKANTRVTGDASASPLLMDLPRNRGSETNNHHHHNNDNKDNNNNNNSGGRGAGNGIIVTSTGSGASSPSSLTDMLARVSAASREADMAPSTPTHVTARGVKPSLHPSRTTASRMFPREASAMAGPTHASRGEESGASAFSAPASVFGAGPAPHAAATRLPLSTTALMTKDGTVPEGAAQAVFTHFWRGHTDKTLADTHATLPALVAPGTATTRGVTAASSLGHTAADTRTHTRGTATSSTDSDAPCGSHVDGKGPPKKGAVAVQPCAAENVDRRFWTLEEVKDMLRALESAGSLYAVAGAPRTPSHPKPTHSPLGKKPQAGLSLRLNMSSPPSGANRVPHPPRTPSPPTAVNVAKPQSTTCSFAAYKREAQRNFTDRYSSANADRLGSSYGGDSSLANSGIGFSPSSTFTGVEGHTMSTSLTNDSNLHIQSSALYRGSGLGYFTHKLGRSSPQTSNANTATVSAESALARVEAALSSMETPEHVSARAQLSVQTRRDMGDPFVPPLLRREWPATLQGSTASHRASTLADLTTRRDKAKEEAAQQREATLQRAAEALLSRFAFRHKGRLYADEAQLALAHILAT